MTETTTAVRPADWYWTASDEDKRDALWEAVLAKVKELEEENKRHASRSYGYFTPDGRDCACHATISQPDGSTNVYFITASLTNAAKQPIHVTVARSYHSSEWFWEPYLTDRATSVVIDGHHYRLGDENYAKDMPSLRGFSGRRHVMENLATGERIVSTNLWYQGLIPPKFREQLPDTHKWAQEGDKA